MIKEKATKIYNELIVGKYINNKTLGNDDRFIDSLLYIELEKNFYEYQEFYNKIGFELSHNIEFKYFFLKTQTNIEEDEQALDKTLIKEHVLATCLCRYLMDKGKNLDSIFDEQIGISENEIEEFLSLPKFEKLLLVSEISSLSEPFKVIFEKKNIFLKNKKNNYVATQIFKHFIYIQEKMGEHITITEK